MKIVVWPEEPVRSGMYPSFPARAYARRCGKRGTAPFFWMCFSGGRRRMWKRHSAATMTWKLRRAHERLEQRAGAGEEKQTEFFGPKVIALCQAADMVFLALHGANGEDGKVQAAFDLFGIRYTGTGYLSSAIAMDKKLTKEFFRAFRVPTPGGAVFTRGMERTELTGCGLNLPVVVKPCCGGSSVGVAVARTEEEYEKALEDAFSYEDQVVVEEFIEGREFSVAVIDGKPILS